MTEAKTKPHKSTQLKKTGLSGNSNKNETNHTSQI